VTEIVKVRIPGPAEVVAVRVPGPVSVVTVRIPGPQGPPGEGGGVGDAAEVHEQETAAATWSYAHSLGRRPVVAVYIEGELVLVPVTADDSSVSVQFPSPQSGTLVLI
jgi:hypothetical protein